MCSSAGVAPVGSRSDGTCATPISRASDVLPTCTSSSHEISESTGSISCCTYSVTAVTCPSVTVPCRYSSPPPSSVTTTGTTYATSTVGNQTVRRNSVRRSAGYAPATSSSPWRTRSSASRSASTVRAPSVVSVTPAVITEYASRSAR